MNTSPDNRPGAGEYAAYNGERSRTSQFQIVKTAVITMKKEKNILKGPSSLSQLAKAYDVDVRTLKNWLNPHVAAIGKKIGRFYTVRQVSIIFELIGPPE